MHRRDFMRLVGVAAAGALVRIPFLPAAVQAAAKPVLAGGLLYKTDGSGKIFVSSTNGKTWVLHSNLGSMYAVKGLAVDKNGRLLATIGYLGRSFGLMLATNNRLWRTT